MAVILTILFAAASAGPPSAPYTAAVRRYASGETTAAVAALRQWPETRVREEVSAIVAAAARCSAAGRQATDPECQPASVWPGLSLSAALMLHTETARADASVEVHDRAALTLAELMAGFPALAPFSERWFGMRARLARAENRWDEATAWAERGVGTFPRSATLWLLLGSIEETLGTQEVSRRLEEVLFAPDPLGSRMRLLATPEKPVEQPAARRADTLLMGSDSLRKRAASPARQPPGAHLARAQQALRQALAVEPERTEARLRLARIAWWRGALAEARAELNRVLAAATDPGTAFLAQLFLGRVEEDAGQLAPALAAYQAAVTLQPPCQSARLALSQTRLRLGDRAGARHELEIALRHAGSRARPDPYWLYLAPPAGAAEEELAALSREVTR
jgi:tetratricopeptide (TPR) repeat protein